jgi:hypothetical protein
VAAAGAQGGECALVVAPGQAQHVLRQPRVLDPGLGSNDIASA